jgi:general secretion pathway protein D
VTIGTRNLETVLSLKDGETSVIGGLIQNSTNNDKSKVYLLGDIPLIGSLFTNTNSSKDKTELVLAITPRLVRGISVPLPGLASFASGKEDHPSLVRAMSSFDLEPVFEGETPPKGIENKNGTPLTPATMPDQAPQGLAAPSSLPLPVSATIPVPVSPVPPKMPDQAPQDSVAPYSLPLPVSATIPVPVSPVPTMLAPAAIFPAPVPPDAAMLSAVPVQRGLLQIAAPSSATVGQQFTLEIKISEVKDLATAPFVLTYDPALVDFVAISEGAFMKTDGKATTFGSIADSVGGSVAVTLSRTAGNGGVSGGGTLATASFRAKKQGSASFAFKNAAFGTSNGSALNILPFSTAVNIR